MRLLLFKGEEILAWMRLASVCHAAQPQTAEAKSEGLFGSMDFRDVAEVDI